MPTGSLNRYITTREMPETLIKESRLDWIIARPAALTNGERTGSYQQVYTADNKTVTGKVSRADTAYFMLKQLADNDYLHKTPCIS